VIARFFAGIGMSGALAVAVASINEFAPRRLRATFVTLVFSGTTIGSGLPGLVAAPLLARFGWESLFFVGGIAPLVLAVAVYVLLPESPKFLCLQAERHDRLGSLLRRFNPQFRAPPGSHFILGGEVNAPKFSNKQFFPGNGESTMLLLCSFAGFCVLGLHFAQVFCVSNVYPTSIRARGIGWFMLFARLGGAIGPSIVGALVGRHMAIRNLFYLASIPLAVGTVASIAVTVIYQRYHQKKPSVGVEIPVTVIGLHS
jgi:AAHS family 4-hydroxybenzoate transporter-like MFS transporter